MSGINSVQAVASAVQRLALYWLVNNSTSALSSIRTFYWILSMDIETYSDLSSAFSRSRSYFEGKECETNWSQREKFLIQARTIVQKVPDTQTTRLDCSIDGLQDAIIKGVNSLRTTLSSAGCLFMQDLASRCGENLHHSFNVEILLQHFIKLCFNTKVITRDMGSDTVIAIITNAVYHVRYMQHIHNTLQDKNPAPRRLACQWLRKLIKHHSSATVERGGGLDLIETCLTLGLTDRDQPTREAMRPTFWAFARRWPDKWERILESLDKLKQQQLVADPSNPYPQYRETQLANLATNNKPSALSQSVGSMSSRPASIKDVKAKLAAQKKAAKATERPSSAGSHYTTKHVQPHAEDPRLTPSAATKTVKHNAHSQVLADIPAPPTASRPRSRHNVPAPVSHATESTNSVSAKIHKPRNLATAATSHHHDSQPAAPPRIGNLASAPVRPRKANTNPGSRSEAKEAAQPTMVIAEQPAIAPLEADVRLPATTFGSTESCGNGSVKAVARPPDSAHDDAESTSADASIYRPPVGVPLMEHIENVVKTQPPTQPSSNGTQYQVADTVINGVVRNDLFENPETCRRFLERALAEIRKQNLDVNGFRKLQLLIGSQPSSSAIWDHGDRLVELLHPLLGWFEQATVKSGQPSSAIPTQLLSTIRLIIHDHDAFCRGVYPRVLSTILIASHKFPTNSSFSNGMEATFELLAEHCELRPALSVIYDVLETTSEAEPSQQRALFVIGQFLRAAIERHGSVFGPHPLDDEFTQRLGKILSSRCANGNAAIRNAAIQAVVALRRSLDVESHDFETLVPLYPPQRELISYYISREDARV